MGQRVAEGPRPVSGGGVVKALGAILVAAAWLWFVWLLRPRPRPRPSSNHPARRFPTCAPVSLTDLADGGPLSAEELWAWRGIVADLRDWQKEGTS